MKRNNDDDDDDVYLNKLQQEVLRNVFSTQIMQTSQNFISEEIDHNYNIIEENLSNLKYRNEKTLWMSRYIIIIIMNIIIIIIITIIHRPGRTYHY